MSRKNIIILSTVLLVASLLWIFGTQFFTGGRNPINPVMFVLLLTIGGSAESIAFFIFKNKILKILPLAAVIGWTAWGTYLYLTSEAWASVTVMDLIFEHYSPVIGVIIALVLLKIFPVRVDTSQKKRG